MTSVAVEDAVAAAVSAEFGLGGTMRRLDGEVDETFRLDTPDGPSFLIKLADPGGADEAVSFQAGLLRHLHGVAPELPVPRVRAAASGADYLRVQAGPLEGRIIWVTSFLPGELLRGVRSTPRLRSQLGRDLAALGRALRGYDHPAAHRHIIWDIQHVAGLRPLADGLDPPERQAMLREIDRFEELTAPALSRVRGQIVHNDFSIDNVLIAPDRVSVSGILDFGDATHTRLINDVAIMAAYQLSDDPDPTVPAIDAIAGYHRVTPLSDAEVELLPQLITARMVTRVVVSQWRARRSPANTRYLLRNTARARVQLNRLLAVPHELICHHIRQACRAGA